MNKFFNFATFLFIFCVFFAKAQASERLKFKNRIYFDNILGDEYQSTDRKNEYKESDARFDIVSQVFFDEKWFGYFNYRIQEDPAQASEAIRRSAMTNGGGDKSYENHFGLTREFYLGYEDDDFRVYGGKFRPLFGEAWRIGRGIWTQELSAGYMQLEMLGIGGALKAGNAKTIGGYSLGLSAYTYDRKNLDNSQITTRDPASKSDGKASDTRGLNSYTVNLDINFDFGEREKLWYRFAYTNLAVNSNQAVNRLAANKIEDQQGFSAMLNYQYPINEEFDIDGLIEYVDSKNINGDSDISDQYLNANLITNFRSNWNATLGFAKRKNMHSGQNGYDQYFSEISAGYTFFNDLLYDKLQLQIGYKNLRTNFKDSVNKRNSYGLMLRYIKHL